MKAITSLFFLFSLVSCQKLKENGATSPAFSISSRDDRDITPYLPAGYYIDVDPNYSCALYSINNSKLYGFRSIIRVSHENGGLHISYNRACDDVLEIVELEEISILSNPAGTIEFRDRKFMQFHKVEELINNPSSYVINSREYVCQNPQGAFVRSHIDKISFDHSDEEAQVATYQGDICNDALELKSVRETSGWWFSRDMSYLFDRKGIYVLEPIVD